MSGPRAPSGAPPSGDDLFAPTLGGRTTRREGSQRPWRLGSQVYVAFFGGALALTSELGVGTTVTLWIPAVGAVEDAVDAEDVPPAEPAPAAAGRVLLVDDEDLVRSVAAFMLCDLGFEVTEAASAEEALRIVEGGLEPDLLVTDHLMPGMNGTDLVRFLKTRRPGLPAILVSGYSNMAGVAADLPRLQKPFRSADLAQMVATVLETNRA